MTSNSESDPDRGGSASAPVPEAADVWRAPGDGPDEKRYSTGPGSYAPGTTPPTGYAPYHLPPPRPGPAPAGPGPGGQSGTFPGRPIPAPAGKPPFEGLSIAAFAMSIAGIAPVALLLAIAAARRIGVTGKRGISLAIAATLISAGWIAAGGLALRSALRSAHQNAATTSHDGAHPRRTTADGVAVGDCLQSFTVAVASEFDVISCTQPHAAEVIGRIELRPGPYPGASVVTQQARSGCQAVAAGIVPQMRAGDLVPGYIVPQPTDWAAGNRSVRCLLVSVGPALTAPLGHRRARPAPPPPG